MEKIKQEVKIQTKRKDESSKEVKIIEQDDLEKEEWPLPSYPYLPPQLSLPSSTSFNSFISFGSFNELHDFFFVFNHVMILLILSFLVEHVDFIFQSDLMLNNKAFIRIAISKGFMKLSI